MPEAVLDVLEDGFHPDFGLVIGQDARTRDKVAILGGVRNRVIHVGDAAFADQLHFAQTRFRACC